MLAVAAAGGGIAPARADDLRGALIAAYTANPVLAAARDQQRGVDEGVPIARADGLPSIGGSAGETEFVKQNPLNTTAPRRQLTFGASLNVPLYSGGAVRNAIRAADTRVDAGKDDLRGSESGVFSQTVAAYMDVIQNDAIVGLNRANVEALRVNLQATRDRFQIGDLTRTDVAQSQSRLAVATGGLRSAESNAVGAREQYIQVVGKPPADLAPPPPLPGLPGTADLAVAEALDHNPDLAAARQRAKAAGFDTRGASAARLPRLSLFADSAYADYLGSLKLDPTQFPGVVLPQTATTADIGVRATIPIFSGGRPTALVRQAQARESQALDTVIAAERSVIAQVRAAYSALQAANEIIVSSQTAVDAAALSLEGVRAENSVGNRTVLDILNAEQEKLNAEVQLVTARRNAYVAGFSLLAAMGRAEARELGLDTNVGVPLYDPDVHYRHVRGDLWDWGNDPKPVAASTTTRGTSSVDIDALDAPRSARDAALTKGADTGKGPGPETGTGTGKQAVPPTIPLAAPDAGTTRPNPPPR